MDDEEGCAGCLIGLLEVVGLFLALAWPILALFDLFGK